MNHRYYLGIDPGKQTGIAMWDKKYMRLKMVETMPIHKAMIMLLNLNGEELADMHIRVEDARKRKWFGNAGREQLQGAGSIKRDCTIWEDFLTDIGASFEMVAPKNNTTKLDADDFKKLTGWKERCSIHARDAAGLVFGI
jgi:hypothetical protein